MADSASTLVTGATGFVGSELTRQLVAGGADVRIFRRPTSSLDRLGSVADAVEHAVGDVTYARSVYEAMEGIDRVYHVAAKVQFDPGDRDTLYRVNAEGTANVVNAALEAGIDRLVHTSSIAALGRPAEPTGMIDEETEWEDAPHRSAYARSKHRAELEVHRGIAEGLDGVIVNPSLIFGAQSGPGNTRRIVEAVRSGWLLAVPPGATNVVDFRDVATGLRAAMVRGDTGRRYLLGGENLSWIEIAGTLADAFGVAPPERTMPPTLLRIGAAVSEAVAAVTRTRPFLSRSLARTASRTYRYDNRRARTELELNFRPFAETARDIAARLEAGRGNS